MKLMEEPVRQQNPYTSHSASISVKMAEQAEIDRLRAEYLKRGGKIDVVGHVARTENEIPKMFDGYKSVAEKRERKQRTDFGRVSKSGRMNITQKSPRSMFQVVVNKYYVGAFKDENVAASARDRYRKANGLPPADY